MFFQKDMLTAYPSSISSPLTAQEGCSRLSPYLSFGVVSQRELIQHANAAGFSAAERLHYKEAVEGVCDGVRFFLERMYWRSSYLQRFELYPQMESEVEHVAMRGVREDEFNERWFDAWCKGQTGFPFVDACVRMLADTGWLNMRMRGMLISFATNELWLHWRKPGMHLAREFLDYEPAIHWHQMQIHAGTSVSEQLTYNPLKQAQDQDPAGRFVRRWLPELAKVPLDHLVEPWKAPNAVLRQAGVYLGQNYPTPLVPPAAAQDAAKQTIAAHKQGLPVPPLAYIRQRRAALDATRQESLF